MKEVVLLGDGLVASLAHYYLTHDSERDVAGFTVDRHHLTEKVKSGLPVVPLDEVEQRFPPSEFDMFVAVGYGEVNQFRARKYAEAKAMGYTLISYVSSHAVTWPDLEIGDNCFIMESNVIQPFARIGNDVIMWGGSHLGHDSVIEDHVFISSHCVVSGHVRIGERAFLGVNSTVRDKVNVAEATVVGAGATITKNTTEKGVYAAPRPESLRITSDRLPGI